VLAQRLNEVFRAHSQKQFPEIEDSTCRRRVLLPLAVVSIEKAVPGHAKRDEFGIWSILRQL